MYVVKNRWDVKGKVVEAGKGKRCLGILEYKK
jgi:hypothetical protein